MSPLLKKFKQDIVAISFLTLGVFLALSLMSFDPQDPSLNSLGSALKSSNYCGIVGSFLSDFLYQLMGVSAWALVLGAFRRSWNSFQGEPFQLKDSRFIWGTLLVVFLSTLLGLYFPQEKLFEEQIYVGGILGLAASQSLVKVFNPIGVQVLVWAGLVLLGVFYSEKSLQDWVKTLRRSLGGASLASWVKTQFVEFKKKKKKPSSTADAKTAKTPLFGLKENFVSTPDEATSSESETVDLSESLQQDLFNEENEENIPAEEEELPGARRRVVMKAKPPKRIENWKMPGISLLEDPPASRFKFDKDELRRKADLLTEKLLKFKIEGSIADAKPGPLVTMYEFKPSPDVKISEISNLEDDLSLALSSESVRVTGQIPGTDVVGIETANSKRETVYYKDLLAEESFWGEDAALPIALGKQANGTPKIVNLRPMPHLLIAGTTGSGKSVFVRSIITGLLFRHSPKTLRLILIDPKMVDLADFKDMPHLILPHIIEPKKAVTALRWAVHEMEKRYRSLSKFGAAKIEVFNQKVSKLSKDELAEHEKFNLEAEEQPGGAKDQYYFQELPFIVIICDELADLMVSEKQALEPLIQKLVQKARACGIHLIFATQSPRKEVVTGLIKTNIPARIALKVASPMDSRIILEESGAERLLPNGDMLFLAPGVNKPSRHHGPYLTDREVNEVVQFWSDQSKPEFDPLGVKMLEGPAVGAESAGIQGAFSEDEAGEEYDHIVRWTTEQKTVSASMLQRRFQIGYPKAARFIELMEGSGLVSAANGSKPRQVLAGPLK